MAAAVRDKLDYIPAWGEFRLRQPNADGFAITKRTGPGHGWVDVDGGQRAAGLGYIGGASGGVAFAMHDFWQRCPVGLDVAGADGDAARFTLWYHAPDAPAMDLRFYHGTMGMKDYAHQNLGLDVTYEDYEPGWGDASGIARTSEFRLWALPATPSRTRLEQMAAQVARRRASSLPMPRCMTPMSSASGACHAARTGRARRHRAPRGARIGFLHRPDRAASLVRLLELWRRHHSYDDDRHVWRFDIGGLSLGITASCRATCGSGTPTCARPRGRVPHGRGDDAPTARSMSIIPAASRVSARVTACSIGATARKQPRISNAAYRRIFYYLAADETLRRPDARADRQRPDASLTSTSCARSAPSAQRWRHVGTEGGLLRKTLPPGSGVHVVRHDLGAAGRRLMTNGSGRAIRAGATGSSRACAPSRRCPSNGSQAARRSILATGGSCRQAITVSMSISTACSVVRNDGRATRAGRCARLSSARGSTIAHITTRPRPRSARRPAIRQGGAR